MKYFNNFDFSGFWDESEYSEKNYTEEFPGEALILSVQQELGYQLPQSYIELMQVRNGGLVLKDHFRTPKPTSFADHGLAISGIYSIGRTKEYSLCGAVGSKFMMEEWGYPNFGVYICDCPSGGHDMILLDYRKCGLTGEPQVVHVDQELNYKITFLAKDFETFIRGLITEKEFNLLENS